jgi:ribokinase
VTAARPPRLVVVGSANLDYIAQVPHLPVAGETVAATGYLTAAGGKGLNQAVAAARQGVDVAFVARVGADDAGQRLQDLLTEEGIDTAGVEAIAGEATGVALVTVDPDGANTVVVAALANGRLTAGALGRAGPLIDHCHVLLAQLEVPLDAVKAALKRARSAGARTVLNPAPAVEPLPPAMLALVDVLVPNEHEVVALTGLSEPEAAARALVASGCPHVVVTLGQRGALLASADGVAEVPAFPARPVDTTAAGDAFCGVLAAALSTGETLAPALRRASAAGALATMVVGAVPSLPDAAGVDGLLDGHTGLKS